MYKVMNESELAFVRRAQVQRQRDECRQAVIDVEDTCCQQTDSTTTVYRTSTATPQVSEH